MSALEKFQEWGFFFNFVSCIIFFILTFIAMGFYPGGSRFDSTRPGYNIIETALSDLGRKIAFNNEPNTISRALFMSGLILLALSSMVFYIALYSFYKETKTIKWMSLTGTIIGFVSAILYILIAVTPVDVNVGLHNKFIYSAAPFKFGAMVLYTIVAFFDKKLPKVISFLFLAILIDYFLLTIAVIIGTSLGGDIDLIMRTFAHTIAIFLDLFIFASISFVIFLQLNKAPVSKLADSIHSNI